MPFDVDKATRTWFRARLIVQNAAQQIRAALEYSMLKPGTTKSELRVHSWVACALLLTLFACGGGDTRRQEPVAQVEQADVNPDPNVPPAMPQALTLPTSPIVPGANVGYLPANWSISPSGQFTYTIPLDVPQGRAGMQPKLSLNYSSDVGNGLLGLGWSVSDLSTTASRRS